MCVCGRRVNRGLIKIGTFFDEGFRYDLRQVWDVCEKDELREAESHPSPP